MEKYQGGNTVEENTREGFGSRENTVGKRFGGSVKTWNTPCYSTLHSTAPKKRLGGRGESSDREKLL